MARPARVYFDAKANAFRSDIGPFGKGNPPRRKPVYWREIPNTPKGLRLAQDKQAEYLKQRDRAEARATEDAGNPRVWSGIVRPYLDACWALVEADKRSEDTYRSHLDRLSRWAESTDGRGVKFADRLALSLDDDDASLWLEKMAAEGLSATRIKGIMESVHAALNWAASKVSNRTPKRIIPANPFAGVKVEAGMPRRVRISTRAEVARFLRAARKSVEEWTPTPQGQCGGCKRAGRKGPCRRSHTKRSVYYRAALVLCRLQAASGTRPKELCTATWDEQVEGKPGWTAEAWRDPATGLPWGLIVVPGKTYRKSGRIRSIPVPPPLRRAIERIRAAGLHPKYLFPRISRDGGPGRWSTDGIDARVRKWRGVAGLPADFQLYALRHRFYTTAVRRAGLSAGEAGAIGGTSGTVVERRYLQEDLSPMFEGASKVRDAGRSRAK